MTSSEKGERNILLFVACLVLATPSIAVLTLGALLGRWDLLPHLLKTVLPSLTYETGRLTLAAVIWSVLLGALPAWILHALAIPGRRAIEFLLILPLVFPAYLTTGFFIETFADTWFWNSWAGLSLAIGAATAPYTFLFFRVALRRISESYDETAQSMGAGVLKRLTGVHLPLAWPALLAGAALTAAECLGEQAASSRMGIRTLSVGIHDLWFGLADKHAALMLVALLLGLCVALIIPPLKLLKRIPILSPSAQPSPLQRTPLHRSTALPLAMVCLLCATPGALLPLGIALPWAIGKIHRISLDSLWADVTGSLTTAGLTLLGAMLLAMPFVWVPLRQRAVRLAQRLAWVSLGTFVMPPLALGVLGLLWSGSNAPFAGTIRALLDTPVGLSLASALRFLPLLLLPLMDAQSRISPALDEVARSLRASPSQIMWKIRFPALLPALRIGGVLVFLESMKDFTLTLLLQPFGHHALSQRIFAWSDLHRMPEASVWTLVLTLIAWRPLLELRRSLDTKV